MKKRYQEGTKNIKNEGIINIWVNIIHYSYSILFFKKCLMIENKNCNMSDGISMYVKITHKLQQE